jgi:hypothetical protein
MNMVRGYLWQQVSAAPGFLVRVLDQYYHPGFSYILGEANLECQLCIEDHMFTQLSVL